MGPGCGRVCRTRVRTSALSGGAGQDAGYVAGPAEPAAQVGPAARGRLGRALSSGALSVVDGRMVVDPARCVRCSFVRARRRPADRLD